MKDRKGFTLIELIIVITIMMILTGGALISLRYLSYADVNKVTGKIDSSLSKMQLETVSKAYPYYYLGIEWDSSEENYYMSMVTSTTELTTTNWSSAAKTIISRAKIADKRITMRYSDENDGSNQVTVREENPLILICYKPDSGAFLSLCKQIIVESNSKKSTIYMVSKTGSHYVN